MVSKMIPGFNGLAVPGPTNMPFAIRQAMEVALEDHRAPDFPEFTLPLLADVKRIFRTTTGQVLCFRPPGQGAGNLLSPTPFRRVTRCSRRFSVSSRIYG